MATEACSCNIDYSENFELQTFLKATWSIKRVLFFFSDASSTAIASCLAQEYNGSYLPTHYLSCKLTYSEQKWCTRSGWFGRRLAYHQIIKISIEQALFHHHGSQRPDGATVWPVSKSKSVHCWALLLSQYNFTVIPVPASLNMMADFLTRHPKWLQ